MHPSPAERFYLEQQYRQQEIWAWQQAEAALLSATMAAQITNQISGTAQVDSQQGAHMHYEEQSFNIGSVQISAGIDNREILQIPGDFGTAVSFVATLSAGRCKSVGQWLWWSFHTSVDGLNWCAINAPGATSFLVAQAYGAASTRQHGPFGSRVALKIGCKGTNSIDDKSWLSAEWFDLRLSIGIQRI